MRPRASMLEQLSALNRNRRNLNRRCGSDLRRDDLVFRAWLMRPHNIQALMSCNNPIAGIVSIIWVAFDTFPPGCVAQLNLSLPNNFTLAPGKSTPSLRLKELWFKTLSLARFWPFTPIVSSVYCPDAEVQILSV